MICSSAVPRFLASFAFVGAAFALVPGGASAAAPAWDLTVTSQPTNFVSGSPSEAGLPAYEIVATNVGGAATSGPFSITDNLPPGIAPIPSSSLEKCDVTETSVTCEYPNVIYPGQSVLLGIEVKVTAPDGSKVLNIAEVAGGGALPQVAETDTTVSATPRPFEFLQGRSSFGGLLNDSSGGPVDAAASHPYQLTLDLAFPTRQLPGETGVGGPAANGGGVRDLSNELPRGMIVNPTATPELCTEAQLQLGACPDGSAVGTIDVITPQGGGPQVNQSPLYNMVAPPGTPAVLAFDAVGLQVFVHVKGEVRSDGDFGLSSTTNDILARSVTPVLAIQAQLWGVPSDPSHDFNRGECVFRSGNFSCPAGAPSSAAFLTLPGSCPGSALPIGATADSWEEPEHLLSASAPITDPSGNLAQVDGCNGPSFEPTVSAQSTTNLTDSPSGFNFSLHQPQAPAINPGDGVLMECLPGSWKNEPTGYSFQWLRNGSPIAAAESSSFQVGSGEAGAAFQCEVTAENTEGVSRSASLPLQRVTGADTAAPIPGLANVQGAISGKEGATCSPAKWSGEPSFSYQWFKDGAPIPGATNASLKAEPTPAASYQCEVIATNPGGTTVAFSEVDAVGSEAEPAPKVPSPQGFPTAFIPESQYPPATAQLKDATVTLPAGMAVNPSQADGLAACTPAQIGMTTAVGESPPHFTKAPNTCPDASKIGKVEVKTPLLAEYSEDGTTLITDPETGNPIPRTLPGSLYIAQQGQNPFGSLLAIYLAIEDPTSGTVAKLAGEVITDPQTGQVTTVFKENPQLPIEDIHLALFGGARGALITPPTCGANATATDLVPWTSPEGQDAHPTDSFQTATTPVGGTCPTSEAQLPSAPTFSAGTTNPQAGAFSPFVLHLYRTDGTQRLTGFDTVLAPGLTGRLAGVPACTDAAIAKAESRSGLEGGAAEKTDPSCPAASRLGSVDVAAGAGPNPFHTQGTAYLAGPYKGAPLSMVVITPAIAGPFDLGTVVVRAALNVDPNTTQIHAISDPFPTILHGIPLDLRSVAVSLDRPNFTLNPTSCNEMAITGSATTALSLTTPLTQRFQVGGCQTLPFKPKLSLELKGKTKRTSHPRLIANLTARPGDANIAKAQVKLPGAAFLDQGHIGTSCTRVQFAAKTCPPGSVYGTVSATTPLLDYTLTGNVYLRASNHQLPDLVADLNGPATQPIEIALAGKTDAVKGALRNTFEAVPDQPVTKFHLELFGGKRGLIILSSGLCKSPKASVNLTGQNGKVSDTTPTVKTSCPKKHKGKSGHRGRRAHSQR